jgi:hypothetical protein
MRIARNAHNHRPPTRLHVQPDGDGGCHIQQLAHSDSAGWYVQKTLKVTPDALHTLIVELRQVECLSLHGSHAGVPVALPKPFHPLEKRRA